MKLFGYKIIWKLITWFYTDFSSNVIEPAMIEVTPVMYGHFLQDIDELTKMPIVNTDYILAGLTHERVVWEAISTIQGSFVIYVDQSRPTPGADMTESCWLSTKSSTWHMVTSLWSA